MAGIEGTSAEQRESPLLKDDIERVKNIYGNCRVIWNPGDYICILTVRIEDVTLKVMIPEGYPKTEAQVVVRGGSLSSGQCEKLASHLKAHRDLVLMVNKAYDWLSTNTGDATHSAKDAEKSRQTKCKPSKKSKGKKKGKHDSDSDDTHEEKKASMKTAIDVISRIQWDEALDQENFTIGYIDRFIGIVEKNFTAFSWADIASVDYNTLAIPKHRIEYFKYKDLIVWEKKSRTDNVFGSTNSNTTIIDVIRDYEKLHSQQQAQQQQQQDDSVAEVVQAKEEAEEDEGSDSDDDFVINVGPAQVDEDTVTSLAAASAAAAADWDDSSISEDTLYPKEKYWGPKKRPTHFLCLRITDPELIANIEQAHDDILNIVPEYHDAILPASRLHITLACLGLDNATEVSKAADVLHRLRPELLKLQPQDIKISLEGIDNFFHSVLYVRVKCEQVFLDFVDKLRNMVKSEGLEMRDLFDFNPHMTLVKLKGVKKHELKTRYLDGRLYSMLEGRNFGSQTINNVWLCEMSETRQVDGFYISPSNIVF